MKYLSIILFLITSSLASAQNVGVGTSSPAGKLDISSTNSGILIPRVALTSTATAAPVTSPVTSMLVYNSNTAGSGATAVSPGFYYWTGAAWNRIIDFGATAGLSVSGDVSGTITTVTVIGLEGKVLPALSAGFLKYNGSSWLFDNTAYLSNTLNSGNIFVGNSSNVATGVPMSGDATISNTGVVTLGTSSNNYIKNQTASAQTAGFSINGNGLVGGNLGIGTTTPTSFLDVNDATSNPRMRFRLNNSTSGFTLGYNNSVPEAYVWNELNTRMVFGTNGAYRMVIDATGNVGIGTTTPTSFLDINDASLNPRMRFRLNNSASGFTLGYNSGVPEAYVWNELNTRMVFGTNNTYRMVIDNAGNVGIGTTTPQTKLHVAGGGIQDLIVGNYGNVQQILIGNGSGYSGIQAILQGSGYNTLALNASGGNVGIGTSSPYQSLSILNTSGLYTGSETSTHGFSVYTGTSSSDYILYGGADKTNGAGYLQSVKWGCCVSNLALNARGGNVGIGTAAPGYTLDVTGSERVTALNGTGNRPVYADLNGQLKTANGDNSVWVMSSNMMYSADDLSTTIIDADNDDNVTYQRTLPFTMTIEGVSYPYLAVCTNGWASFETALNQVTTTTATATSLPSSSFSNPTIFPFWTDLKDFGSGEYIKEQTVGTSPNRTYVLEWQMRAQYSTVYQAYFQMEIHETSNLINVKYYNMNANMCGQQWSNGSNINTAIGFQLAGGASAKAFPITFNGKVLDDNASNYGGGGGAGSEGWSVCPLR